MREVTLVDILAALDAAIDELASVPDSRDSRGSAGHGTATGGCKYLNNKAIPVIPVIPVPKRGFQGMPIGKRNNGINEKIGRGPYKPIYFFTGITGITGIGEDSCGVQRSRDGKTRRESTGITGTLVELDFDRLDPSHPPGDVPQRRWVQFLDDARAFCVSGFAEQAKALGWTAIDLFGCDDARPFARIDCMGLIWLLNGDRLVALTAQSAAIETKTGTRTSFRKKERPVGNLHLLSAATAAR